MCAVLCVCAGAGGSRKWRESIRVLSSDGSSSQLGPCLETLHRNPSMSQVKQAQARIKVSNQQDSASDATNCIVAPLASYLHPMPWLISEGCHNHVHRPKASRRVHACVMLQ